MVFRHQTQSLFGCYCIYIGERRVTSHGRIPGIPRTLKPAEALRQGLLRPTLWRAQYDPFGSQEIVGIFDIRQGQSIDGLLDISERDACSHVVARIEERDVRIADLVAAAVSSLVSNLQIRKRLRC